MPNKPTIAFAHGIWADGSCFNKVMAPLVSDGYNVITSQHSLDTAQGDIDTCIATFNRVDGPIVLVGHSYGGTVITGAGVDERVAALVYICALACDETETSESLQAKFPTTDVFQRIEVADGRVWMRPDGIECFCGDLPVAEQKLIWADGNSSGGHALCGEGSGCGLEREAELVHRRRQRSQRPPRTGAIRGQAHGR